MTANDELWTIPPITESNRWQWNSINYTSLVGLQMKIPELELDIPWDTNFKGHTVMDIVTGWSYASTPIFTVSMFEFACPSVPKQFTNCSWISLLSSDFLYPNGSSLLEKQERSGSGFFLDTNYTFGSGIEGPQNVLFGSFQGPKVSLWSCSVYLNTRNVTLACGDAGFLSAGWLCYATSMGIPTISMTTPLSNYTIAANTFGKWPILDVAGFNTSSVTERYIAQGNNLQDSLVDLSSLDNFTFATRLTKIFNTWYLTLHTNNNTLSPMKVVSGTPFLLAHFPIFKCNWFWFTVLVLISLSLILCCALNIWIARRLSTPDILGSVSCLTIENPYVSIPGVPYGSGSGLDGLHRAKLLKKLRVQLRDVQPREYFGKFALTSDVQTAQRTRGDRKIV
jgi:hypothetical protein